MNKFGLNKILDKVKFGYTKINKKSPYIEPIIVISASLLVALLVIVSVSNVLKADKITIESNKAEVAFYNGNYDVAISEYEKLQEDEEWPFWQVKIAEIHSIKGSVDKSNDLLRDALNKRNKIMYSKEKDKYKEKDSEFVNYIIFTYFMNGEYEEALSIGELFIKENGSDKTLERTMYTVYMANNQKDKANEIIDTYDVDKNSAYDIALLAKMNMLINNWDTGFSLLNEAFNIDNNEVKVFDVITQFASYDRDLILTKLTKLVDENPDELSYKMLMAKVYSMLPQTMNLSNNILESIKGEVEETIPYKVIMSKIYKNNDNEAESSAILKEIINNKDKSFIGYHISAWQSFEDGEYDKALDLCKRSILENKDYPDNYGFLIPEIMTAKGQVKTAEGYFRTALQKEPFNYNIMIKIAEYYTNNSIDNDNARRYYTLASLLKPNDAEIYYNIATLDMLDDKVDSAIANLNKAIAINPAVAKYHRTIGTIYLNKGNNEKAIESIRNAYGTDKNDALTLNNAGCYYISIEGDIERGMENIKGAYEGINNSMDEETRNTITQNYEKAKELYDKYNLGNSQELVVPDFT